MSGEIVGGGFEDVDPEPPEETLTIDNVVDLAEEVGAQNAVMLGKLKLVGKEPTPLLVMACQLEALKEFFIGGDEDALEAYELAVKIKFNQALRARLSQFAAELVVPGGN